MRARFMEEAICQKEARLLSGGALAVDSGRHTERAVNSRYIVRDQRTQSSIHWSDFNKPMNADRAADFLRDLQTHLASNRAFEVRGWMGPVPVEFLTTSAWHAAFCETFFRSHFIESVLSQVSGVDEAFGTLRIWHDPNTKPAQYEISSPDDALILIDPRGFNIAIVGTALAAEIVDAVFFLLNDRLPGAGLVPLKASAICAENGGDSTLLIGSCSAGRTDLALRSKRFLVSDDQIIWSDRGLSNPASGCYTRLDPLSMTAELDSVLNRFGTFLENAAISDQTRLLDRNDTSRLRSARACFDLKELPRVFDQSKEAESPATVILLVDDPTGGLPLVSRLDTWQFRYHFVMTLLPPFETHDASLRASFGTTFLMESLPHEASMIANALATKAEAAGSRLWLMNTGLGHRFSRERYGEILHLIESGQLDHGPFHNHPVFGFEVPVAGRGLEATRVTFHQNGETDALVHRYLVNQSKFTDTEALEIFWRGGPQSMEVMSASGGRIAFPQ